jgi:hypothetical protein
MPPKPVWAACVAATLQILNILAQIFQNMRKMCVRKSLAFTMSFSPRTRVMQAGAERRIAEVGNDMRFTSSIDRAGGDIESMTIFTLMRNAGEPLRLPQ